ncbi:hypothetical protein GALL_57800 [mine drainage metagenome]|uniref:Uncharacterized protein n=1 Tax=mine drainage metagenome TaxID=410659 RepID=A0A1J5SW15_9ZZZZ
MMNGPIDIQLKSIQQKLQQLLKQYQTVQKENAQLKKEAEKQKIIINSKTEQIELLQQKLDAVQVGVNNWSDDEKINLQKRIDTYLKEIDKCLSLLNAE